MYVQRMCPWCTRKHAGASVFYSPVHYIVFSPVCSPVHNIVYSPVHSIVYSSVHTRAHLDTSAHSWTHVEHSWIHLEHSWNTAGVHLVCGPGAQLEHSWSTFGVQSKCTAGAQPEHLEHMWHTVQVHFWTHLGQIWVQLDTSDVQTKGTSQCTVQYTVQGTIQCTYCAAMCSPGYHPLYIPCTVQGPLQCISCIQFSIIPCEVQCISCVQFSVHLMYSPGYSPVYIPRTTPFTVQCMVQYTFQYIPSEQSSMYQFTSSIQSSVSVSVFATSIRSHEWLVVIFIGDGKEQIVNRLKEGRIKRKKFKWTENWIVWHWIQVSGMPELSCSSPQEQYSECQEFLPWSLSPL